MHCFISNQTSESASAIDGNPSEGKIEMNIRKRPYEDDENDTVSYVEIMYSDVFFGVRFSVVKSLGLSKFGPTSVHALT
jgi:hypothetical protein